MFFFRPALQPGTNSNNKVLHAVHVPNAQAVSCIPSVLIIQSRFLRILNMPINTQEKYISSVYGIQENLARKNTHVYIMHIKDCQVLHKKIEPHPMLEKSRIDLHTRNSRKSEIQITG